jgi:hypothetical protein
MYVGSFMTAAACQLLLVPAVHLAGSMPGPLLAVGGSRSKGSGTVGRAGQIYIQLHVYSYIVYTCCPCHANRYLDLRARAHARPQLAVWDFWPGFARARAEFSFGNRYLK